jgi:hypothetical protein
MTPVFRRYLPAAYSLIGSAVFLDSLRYKFTDAPETQVIFGKLSAWAAGFGGGGLFEHSGLFSQYVIGSAELAASALLLAGLIPALNRLQIIGALIAAAVMTGAVSFHLFTPLGIDPNNDGAGLFVMAVTVWLSSLALIISRHKTARAMFRELASGVLGPRVH